MSSYDLKKMLYIHSRGKIVVKSVESFGSITIILILLSVIVNEYLLYLFFIAITLLSSYR